MYEVITLHFIYKSHIFLPDSSNKRLCGLDWNMGIWGEGKGCVSWFGKLIIVITQPISHLLSFPQHVASICCRIVTSGLASNRSYWNIWELYNYLELDWLKDRAGANCTMHRLHNLLGQSSEWLAAKCIIQHRRRLGFTYPNFLQKWLKPRGLTLHNSRSKMLSEHVFHCWNAYCRNRENKNCLGKML